MVNRSKVLLSAIKLKHSSDQSAVTKRRQSKMSKSEVSEATSFESGTEQPIELPLIAFCVDPDQRMALVPAPSTRAWMDATDRHFANRCLPLLIANQAGWFLLNPYKVALTWSGGAS